MAPEDSGLPSVEKPVYVGGEARGMAGGVVGLAMAAEPRKCRASLRRLLRHRSGGIGQGPWARGPKMWTGLFSCDQARGLGQGGPRCERARHQRDADDRRCDDWGTTS